MKKHILAIASLFLFSLYIHAQGTVEDYARANRIDKLYASKTYYADVKPVWIDNTPSFWYKQNTPDGKQFVLVNASTRKKGSLFNQPELARQLSAETGRTILPGDLPFDLPQVDASLKQIRFDYDGSKWSFTTDTKSPVLKREGKSESALQRYWGDMRPEDRKDVLVPSPDGQYEAFLRNDNVYIRGKGTDSTRQLSFDGSPGEYYGADLLWSPDSRKLSVMKIRPAEQRYIQFIEAAPDDQLQPRLHQRRYAKPGDALPYQYPHIFDVQTGRQVKPDNSLFLNPYINSRLKWNADSRAVTFEYNERGHQVYRVLEVDAEDGGVRVLVDEYQKTFINYRRYFRQDLADGKQMIWMSERDNWGHLYMYDRETGRVKHQITKGEWYVRDVIHVDEAKQQILFSANGYQVQPGEDPYLVKYYRIRFDGTGMTCLTPEEGMHAGVFSADNKYFVDTYSKVNIPPVTVLRESETGKVIMPLEKADITDLRKAGWSEPIEFSAKGRDGKTDIWGVIVKPSTFDPSRKYPVLEYIYAGPGAQHAPKAFAPTLRFLHNMAEIGFVVVMLDGMGTSFRSKAFEDICCKNLKDAGLPDRVAWITAAARQYPWMDADRVGLYGGSAGAQNAMCGVLYHPEFYKAAYAGCGCHDNRMDKIWWNEQWMGYPIGPQYAESSNVDNAWRLTRPLMLMVGEVDDNVDPASTMQVVKALEKAGKEFELVVAPSTNHVLGGPYGDRKRYDFFVKQLHGIAPPDWNTIPYPSK